MLAKRHPLYELWRGMRRRCLTPTATGYANYGGRGIGIAPEWDDFWRFVADIGPRPPGTTLDRIDNDKGYGPGNCRWATHSEQRLNSRQARYIAWNGERRCVTDWAAQFGVTQSALSHRIRNHGVEKAMAMGGRTA